jgi:hypothetical protein
LLNYRVDPDVLAGVLPHPFRPLVVHGSGVAGLCLIRLRAIRPAGLPQWAGLTSENAAHRVAVEWDGADGPVAGVYVPRRDTSSHLATLLGGRAFPGAQHLARFDVDERDGRYSVAVDSRDGSVRIVVAAHVAPDVMPGSVFGTVDEASQFFRCAPVAYAATSCDTRFDGVALGTEGWGVEPLHVDEVSSTFFDDIARFPSGSARVDSAFLMRGLDTTWRPVPTVHVADLTLERVSSR